MGFESLKRELGMRLFWQMFFLNIVIGLIVYYCPLELTQYKVMLVAVAVLGDILAIVVVYYTFKWGDKRWDEITKKRKQ